MQHTTHYHIKNALATGLFTLFIAGLATGCSAPSGDSANTSPASVAIPAVFTPGAAAASPCVGITDPTEAVTVNRGPFTAPENVIDANKTYCAILTTDKGRIVLELFAKVAPQNVNNFVFLARKGFYDGVTWHRVITGFVAQTGDPTGTGSGSPGYNVALEVHPTLKYDRPYLVGVARSRAKDSAGSQFFITYAPLANLDPVPGQSDGYTIMGQVVEGFEVVNQIAPRDPDQFPNFTGDPLVTVRIVEK